MKCGRLTTHLGPAAKRSAVLVSLWICMVLPVSAETCGTCQKPITSQWYWFKSPALPQNVPLCKPCSTLDSVCFICKIPIREKSHRLSDGRLLCPQHVSEAVTDEREAIRLFENTKREFFPVLEGMGTLPKDNITVKLVDAVTIAQLAQSQHSTHQPTTIMGLTQTTRQSDGTLHHTIYLLSGLPPGRLAAVSSHEYAHVWLHENLPANRRIDKNTVEGFCELVALHVMNRVGEETEKRVILQNAYTKGHLDALVKAQDQHQFYQVVKWMKHGSDKQVNAAGEDTILATKPSRTATETPNGDGQPLSPVATPVPDTLELKGITGSAQRPFALINNQTFAPQEKAKVRVGSSEVMIQCLEIRKKSVLIQVEGSPYPAELSLPASP